MLVLLALGGITCVVYMVQVYNAVQGIPAVVEQHDDLISKLYPTLEYQTDNYETVRDVAEPQELPRQGGTVAFQDVDFAYRTPGGKRVPVFTGLDLNVGAGEQVGIVGLSGAGKSTLASLLMRFDDIDGGSIEVDGVDIRQAAQVELRQRMAYVPQEPLLFHLTVRENISYFKPEASQAEIERAAAAAHAKEFIQRLPDGYDTLVGERGVKLSGGQKQRIVLARSILKDAEIMIFDEATSALDSVSEKIIQASLPGIIGKRTAIVIAHRLSTVADLDRIVVMHQGKIVEQGTHHELLARQGRYHELWQKQSRLASE
jgi:ATP-binding cassette subfamily B protein